MVKRATTTTQQTEDSMIDPQEADKIRRAVEAAIPAAKARAELLERVRRALESGAEDEAIPLMRSYCGIDAPSARAA